MISNLDKSTPVEEQKHLTSTDVMSLFFHELKQYNSNNYVTIERCHLEGICTAKIYKSFSSVVTRYFIFREKHPEIPESMLNMLYYKLNIDMIARYFSEYPESTISDLLPFQNELVRHSKKTANKGKKEIVSTPVITEESITIGA